MADSASTSTRITSASAAHSGSGNHLRNSVASPCSSTPTTTAPNTISNSSDNCQASSASAPSAMTTSTRAVNARRGEGEFGSEAFIGGADPDQDNERGQ